MLIEIWSINIHPFGRKFLCNFFNSIIITVSPLEDANLCFLKGKTPLTCILARTSYLIVFQSNAHPQNGK